MEIYFDSETTQNIILIAFSVVFLALAVIFCVWIAKELLNWYKLIEKEHRKFVFGALGLGLLFLVTTSNWGYTLSYFGFIFSCWLVSKAYQRVIKLEPRESDLFYLKEYIERKEDFEVLIATRDAYRNFGEKLYEKDEL